MPSFLDAISILLFSASLAVATWFVYDFVKALATEKGTLWQRLLAASKDSATVIWSKFVIVVGMIVAVLDRIATAFGDPALATQIQTYLTPQYVGYGLAALFAVNMWARFRTLGK